MEDDLKKNEKWKTTSILFENQRRHQLFDTGRRPNLFEDGRRHHFYLNGR